MLRDIRDSVLAGILIAIGGCVYLGTPSYRIAGAVLFSVALLFICYRGYLLYTGRIGFLLFSHTKRDFIAILIAFAGNLLTAYLLGRLCAVALPVLSLQAVVLCENKLKPALWLILVRGALCGVLMYLSVALFKEKKTPVGIFFAIPVFILSGFEHSIADCFYFGAAEIFSAESTLFLLVAVAGNTLGALLTAALEGRRQQPVPENEKT